jgi:hypothetical protein
MSKYFSINGYWKDDKSEFEGFIVKEYDDAEEDEDLDNEIFYYGLSENDLKHSVDTGGNDSLDIVVTSFEEINFK